MFDKKRILVVAAHPDDELLGLGATIHKLVNENGCVAREIILGEGITSRADVRDPEKWEKELFVHRSNIFQAQNCIGYDSVGIFNLPDNRFDSVALLDIIKIIEKEKQDFQPDIVFTHFQGDLNIDHQKTFEAVMTACRPLEGETVKTILSFETPSGTEWQAFNNPNTFTANFYFEIGAENLQAKINGIQAYEYEVRKYPHPRSPEALKVLAQKRGVEAGLHLAEAFVLVRHIG